MLPKLDFKRSDGMDKALYFDRKLKEFFVKNRDTKETVSKHNKQTIMLLREAKQELMIQRRKFGMLFHIAITVNDKETIGNVRIIHNSLKEQIKMIENLDKMLFRVRIDEKWADAIKTYVYDKVVERCMRLEKLILPDLIKMSKLNIYDYHLQTVGITLEEDILNHTDDDDDTYYNHIMSTIEQCEKTMPAEKLKELNDMRERHIAACDRKRELLNKEKQRKREEQRQDFEKDAVIMLQNWATDTVAIEQRANGTRKQMVYKKALQMLEELNDELTGEDLKFKLIAVARYNTKNRISTSAFKWLKIMGDGYALAGGFGNATPFFSTLEPEKFENAINYCKEKGYVIATVECDITGKKEEDVIYDYYQIMPEITWKDYKTYGRLTEEERKAFVRRIFHQSMCVIKCAMLIQEAYSAFGDKTHPINSNIDKRYLKSHLAEVMSFEGCWENTELLNSTKKISECRDMRTRMKFLSTRTKKYIADNLDFALTDKEDKWVEAIKSIVNLSSYTKDDLKKLYEILNKNEKENPLPDEFYIENTRRSGKTYTYLNHYVKSKTPDERCIWYDEHYHGEKMIYRGYDYISKLDYVEVYLQIHEWVFI